MVSSWSSNICTLVLQAADKAVVSGVVQQRAAIKAMLLPLKTEYLQIAADVLSSELPVAQRRARTAAARASAAQEPLEASNSCRQQLLLQLLLSCQQWLLLLLKRRRLQIVLLA